jgi:hypothetical protein
VTERIKSLLPTWRFPAPSGGTQRFVYPFTFRPAATGPAPSRSTP